MLELLFQGLIEWLYSLILETWEYFFSVFTSVLSVDFEYLKQHIPIIPEIMKIMLAVGWALLLGNLVFQAMKSMMAGLGFEGEDPKLLFSRSFVFSFLLLASPQICRLGLNMTARILDRLGAIDAVNVNLIDADTFVGMGAAWLLTIIINLILMFRLIRFLLKIVEQYLVIAFLTICAPLAFGVGGSKNTADIFTGWCRMFASMCFLMVSNMTCFKLLLSLLGNVPVGADIFLWIALVFGVVRLAQKADDIITRIGLNPAITGDSRGRSLPGLLAYTVMRTMVTQAVKTTAGGGKGSGAGQNGGKKSNSTNHGGNTNHGGHGAGTGGHGAGNGSGAAGRSSGKRGPAPFLKSFPKAAL